MNKKNVSLSIDTAKREETIVRLTIDGTTFAETTVRSGHTAQSVLPLIGKLMQTHEVAWEDLTEVEVNPGPGSFTGIRVGVAIANTIGWLLKIPVNGKYPNVVIPRYN